MKRVVIVLALILAAGCQKKEPPPPPPQPATESGDKSSVELKVNPEEGSVEFKKEESSGDKPEGQN
jgi:hypothetical protein